jgi:hypothetical protein
MTSRTASARSFWNLLEFSAKFKDFFVLFCFNSWVGTANLRNRAVRTREKRGMIVVTG